MQNTNCESCMVPFRKDRGMWESEKYCSYCFRNGKLCYEGTDLKGFQKFSYDKMVANGMNRFKAKLLVFLIRFAPRWKVEK